MGGQGTGPTRPQEDLGFGGVVIQRSRGRFLHRDGTPSARKYGLGRQALSRGYLRALAAPWPTFLTWTAGLLLLVNGVFALGYLALGPALAGTDALRVGDPFLGALYYSIGVFTSLGTGPVYPVGETAIWLSILETLAGLLVVICLIGVMLARMTRPRASIRFTHSAAVAPYDGGRGFMFRLVNQSPAELFEVSAQVTLAWFEEVDGRRERRFHPLSLERPSVEFFTLHWTVVHPITSDSPLAGVTPERLRDAEAEFLVLITSLESTFSTRVVSRTSYIWEEVRWDARFADVFVDSPDGVITIDVERLDRLDRLPEGTTRTPATSENGSTAATVQRG
ncbi:MAG TPA: ion channel [Gemmatimonadales bacterium]|nr:ion channel [Gemmatimonadales bacterium]